MQKKQKVEKQSMIRLSGEERPSEKSEYPLVELDI